MQSFLVPSPAKKNCSFRDQSSEDVGHGGRPSSVVKEVLWEILEKIPAFRAAMVGMSSSTRDVDPDGAGSSSGGTSASTGRSRSGKQSMEAVGKF